MTTMSNNHQKWPSSTLMIVVVHIVYQMSDKWIRYGMEFRWSDISISNLFFFAARTWIYVLTTFDGCGRRNFATSIWGWEKGVVLYGYIYTYSITFWIELPFGSIKYYKVNSIHMRLIKEQKLGRYLGPLF